MDSTALSTFSLHLHCPPPALGAALVSSLGSVLGFHGTAAVLELRTDWKRWDETGASMWTYTPVLLLPNSRGSERRGNSLLFL